MQALHRWMADEMAAIGAHIDAFEYCPDHPDGTVERYRRVSDRRKPGPGMITDLLGRFPVNADDSILIGDKAERSRCGPGRRPARDTCFRAATSKPL